MTNPTADQKNVSCVHRAGCPKPDVCAEVGHCTSMRREDIDAEKALTSKQMNGIDQISEDSREAAEGAIAVEHVLRMNMPDLPKLLSDAYQLGHYDGMRKERQKQKARAQVETKAELTSVSVRVGCSCPWTDLPWGRVQDSIDPNCPTHGTSAQKTSVTKGE